jgi:hypothetical protein
LHVILEGHGHFIALGFGMNVGVGRPAPLVVRLQLLWALGRLGCEFSLNIPGALTEDRVKFSHGFELLGPDNFLDPLLIASAGTGLLISPWIG